MSIQLSTRVMHIKDETTGSYDTVDILKGSGIDDVQVNGTSVVSQGVADIPIATGSSAGVVGVGSGLSISGIGIRINASSSAQVKEGTQIYRPIVPNTQHESVFYGLAKAAADTTQSASTNPVGTYTDAAKVAIQKMLGIYEAPWELIREDTFTLASQGNIEISVDDNGQPFELTDIYCTFGLPVQATEASVASYGRVRFYNGNNNLITEYIGTWTQAANASARSASLLIEQENGVEKISYTKNALDTGEPTIQTFNPRTTSSDTSAGRYLFRSTKHIFTKVVFEAITGTALVRVYGKRKWS